MAHSIILAFAYWEIAKKQENKSIHLLFVAAGAILLIPWLPVENLDKPTLPFFFVDAVIALYFPFALKSKNPLLIILGIAASFAVAVDILGMTVPSVVEALLLGEIGTWTPLLSNTALLGLVLWKPVMSWVYRGLQRIPLLQKPQFSLISGGAEHADVSAAEVHDIRDFAQLPVPAGNLPEMSGIEAAKQDLDILEPALKDAARMVELSHKPFLTPTEAMFYLDMDEEELDSFMVRFEIRKLYLTGDEDKWVMRRESVENIV